MNRRTKKAIIHNLEKLIKKYGFGETRQMINKYFSDYRERDKLIKEINDNEKSLQKLRNKLSR